MGWRENMGVESENECFKPYPQKSQNPQKVKKKDKKNSFEAFESIEGKNQKVKTLQDELNYLWDTAWNLAEWVDDADSKIDWKERTKFVPEVFAMSARIGELENQMEEINILPACCIGQPAKSER